MLVPRRKGQLLKLLILIPLTLLFFTSIYYQFYYDPAPMRNGPVVSDSMAAPLVAGDDYLSFSEKDSGFSEQDSVIAVNRVLLKNRPGPLARHGQRTNSQEENEQEKRPKIRFNYNRADEKFNPMFPHSSDDDPQDRAIYRKRQHHVSSISELETSHQNSQNIDRDTSTQHRVGHNNKNSYHLIDDNKKQDQDQQEQNERTNVSPRVQIVVAEEDPLRQFAHKKKINSNNDQTRATTKAPATTTTNANSEKQREAQEANDAQDAAVIPAPSEPNGPGELGRPVVLKNLTKEQQQLVNVGWENNAFNQYVSDIISINRSLPDVRDPSCKQLSYPNVLELPPTSVIICFHNEAWSVLLRTVHSVLNRSPKHLIKEIILVDDFSNKPHLGQQLDDYMKQLGGVVKIVRASKREGLIRARLLGARAATAPVLTFLDSHCECAEGWIEPLLARIHEDSHAVVCPVIDVISDKTFEYHYKGDANSISVGGFDWNLQFNWHSIPDREKKRRKHPYDPLRSPTMAGGLFSIDKAFFERLGTYDSGFDIWGGENLELSFKTWMCGGTLEIIPCSHVGHVFRSRSPYKWRTGVNVLRRNSVRLAEVWMDDYKKYYYDRIGHDLGDYGDISDRLELRKKLQCKPFSYFVKEIYPELFIPGEAIAYGEIRNEAPGHIKMCLDSSARKTDFQKPLGLYPCHGSGGNQYWLLSRDGEIRRDEACVDYAGKDVVLFPCHGSGGNQLWLFDNESHLLRHSTSGRCMELAHDKIHLKMSDCDPSNAAQKWTFQHFNATLAAQYSYSV